MADPEVKEAATEEAKEETKEEKKEEKKEETKEPAKPKEPEKPKEQEQDAAEETRARVGADSVGISKHDSTLNVMPTDNGKFLMALTEGGFQYLLAGARSTVGLKSGRYMFEVKIVESHKNTESQGNQGRVPLPRNLVRLGLSHAGTSLFLADGSSDNVSFDSEGFFVFEKSRRKAAQKFERDATIAMLVNLDESSPNANTISLFRNGRRISEPQAIPEKLRGKPLFPTITYRNVTLQVNLGPVPLSPLEFKCNMLSSATSDDVELVKAPEPKDGKNEVVLPVGLPGQGFFDWVDAFIEKNPDYTELSDRKIIDWACKSGLWRPKSVGGSNDKPDAKFGIPLMDDLSVRRLLTHIAPTVKRNFIVPELAMNLTAAGRKKSLQNFAASGFKSTARVMMGEPSVEFREQVQAFILADKKAKAEAEHKRKLAEEERKRNLEDKKKKAEELRKAREAAAKRKREGKEEEPEEKAEEFEEPKEEPKPMDIVVELTDEEKALWFRKSATMDMTEQALKAYAEFTLPTKEEGFEEIAFDWQGEGDSEKLLKDWIFARKLAQRVDDIQPGAWFKEELTKWTKSLQEWRKKQSEWKDPNKKKQLLAARAEKKKKEAEEKGEEAKEDMEIDMQDLDVFGVEDILDVGTGEPLFANFVYEDWALLSARFELHLLMHSFKKDLNDSDRTSFAEKDLAFYYNRYFKKAWNIKNFGVDKLAGLSDLVKDTFKIKEQNSFLESVLEEDTPSTTFVKVTEEHRRERQRRVDAGDETADLKFPRTASQPLQRPPPGGAPVRQAVGSRGAPPPRGSAVSAFAGGAQKRAYTPPPASSSYVAKQPRTSSYGSGYHRR